MNEKLTYNERLDLLEKTAKGFLKESFHIDAYGASGCPTIGLLHLRFKTSCAFDLYKENIKNKSKIRERMIGSLKELITFVEDDIRELEAGR